MWVFNRDGFFSAVEHRDDNSKVMVRARAKEDIKNLSSALQANHQLLDEDTAPVYTPDGDYQNRLTVSK